MTNSFMKLNNYNIVAIMKLNLSLLNGHDEKYDDQKDSGTRYDFLIAVHSHCKMFRQSSGFNLFFGPGWQAFFGLQYISK